MANKLSIAEKYIHDVTKGNVTVNQYVQLAVERHLKDLKDGVSIAANVIDSGKAKEKLDAWITMSNEEPPEPEEDE